MALIECDECGGQVSTRAQACPNCGAPVETKDNRIIEAGSVHCPYCITTLDKSATVCPGCRARKGYMMPNSSFVGKTALYIFIASGIFGAPMVMGFAIIYWQMMFIALPYFGFLAYNIYLLVKGPRWHVTE